MTASGNTVDITKLRRVIQLYGQDALRFYVLRAAPFGADLDWSNDEFKRTHTELGNVVGNLLNRVLKMTGGVVPPVGQGDDLDLNLADLLSKFGGSLESAYNKLELQQTATLPVELARAANQRRSGNHFVSARVSAGVRRSASVQVPVR